MPHRRPQPPPAGFPTQFTEQRTRLLLHANRVLDPAGGPLEEKREVVPQLAALVNASLEMLKVAEEELVRQYAADAEAREKAGHEIERYRAMFMCAPTILVITTPGSAIREMNLAAEALFGRTAHQIDGKLLCDMVLAGARRTAFKASLALLPDTHAAVDWKFTIERLTRAPIEITASVRVVTDKAIFGGGQLYWELRAGVDAE